MWVYYLAVLLLTFYYWWWKKSIRLPSANFPNGPIGLPIFGYLSILTEKNILVALDKAHDKYGEVMSVNIGPGPRTVVIGDYQVLKEVFKDDKATPRPDSQNWFHKEFRFGDELSGARGILFSKGEEWHEQRRFALRRLRDFGLGKSSMEELIQEEIQQLCSLLDKEVDGQQPLKMDLIYNLSVVNALWTLITGSRLSLGDPKIKELVSKIDELVKERGTGKLLIIFPWLRNVIPEKIGWNKQKRNFDNLFAFLEQVIDEHQVNFNDTLKENPNDFIDAYLAQIQASKPGSSFYGSTGLKSLKITLLDLLLAGMETTSTALSWITLYMIRYPEVQAQVQAEILSNVGKSRLVNLEDRPNLPYTEAVIQEVMRITCNVPLSVLHSAQADIHVAGLHIPTGTSIIQNLHRVMSNPRIFAEPTFFRPDRFLQQGKYVKNDHNIPFSIGKRDCLGKSLAQAELFLFFSTLMQRFKFVSVHHEDLTRINMEPVVNFAQTPPPFEVIIKRLQN